MVPRSHFEQIVESLLYVLWPSQISVKSLDNLGLAAKAGHRWRIELLITGITPSLTLVTESLVEILVCQICEHFLLAGVGKNQAEIGQAGVRLDEGTELA